MSNIYKLTGTLQHYVWGGKDYIPTLLHIAKAEQYYAEYWLGAHNSSPSLIETNGSSQPLTEFLAQNPTALGAQSRALFGDGLPYLLKILDVKKPLSIQLHPTKKQAEIGFAAENENNVDLKDPKRTYKDNNHKPEMMIALSDFWLLHGFKNKAKIIDTLKTRPSLTALCDKLATQDLHAFYADIMQAEQNQLETWLNPIINANQTAYQNKLDAGLICFYLFNIVHIKPGEGIFQDAGIPHAYLRGQNIELMACSDNVIRGGLTPKHIDIPELLKVIDCREVEPQIIPPAPVDKPVFTYSTPAKDFALENVNCRKGALIQGKSESATILLVMKGNVKIHEKSTALSLSQGESAFICADTAYEIEGVEEGYCVLAKLP